jgi:hypothetical protein
MKTRVIGLVMPYDDHWTAVIIKEHAAGRTMMDCGSEATEAAATAWCTAAVAAYNSGDGPHLIPDMYDRGERALPEMPPENTVIAFGRK